MRALDRSFVTDRAYTIARSSSSFALEEVVLDPPVRKEFPLDGEPGGGPEWEQCLVAVGAERIVGVAGFEHQRWNRRTGLWHLHVAPPHRGRGVGGLLVGVVVSEARRAGSRCVWLETSTLAHPAIAFYRRLGFELCGLDTSLYPSGESTAGEVALYFARALLE